jgi:hypothetical protein
MSETNSSG